MKIQAKKFFLSLLGGTILLMTCGFSINLLNHIEEKGLEKALTAFGVKEIIELNLYSFTKITINEAYSQDIFINYPVEILQSFGYDITDIKYNLNVNDKQRIAISEVKNQEEHIIVTIFERRENNNELNTYLNISVKTTDISAQSEYKRKISKVLGFTGGNRRIFTCLSGLVDGKLDEEQAYIRLNRAFGAVKSKIENLIRMDNITSATGYSASLGNYFVINNQKVNLNMGIRYNPILDCTYIVAGSPVITREY